MNKLNFLINEFQGFDLTEMGDEEVLFSFSLKEVDDLYRFNLKQLHTGGIYSSEQVRFSIHFNLIDNKKLNGYLVEKILENTNLFIQFIFHPNFKRVANNPVIFISVPSENDLASQRFISLFESALTSQGFGKIEWVYFNKSDEISDETNNIYELHSVNEFKIFYYELLKEKFCVGNYIGIVNKSDQPLNSIIYSKKQAEVEFKKALPYKYKLLHKYERLETEIPILEKRIIELEEELKNQKSYLQIIKEEDEANKINNFYYYEYEILPLWYKKMGHLLKVFTGKRNFRSLFDNNVKKYKD